MLSIRPLCNAHPCMIVTHDEVICASRAAVRFLRSVRRALIWICSCPDSRQCNDRCVCMLLLVLAVATRWGLGRSDLHFSSADAGPQISFCRQSEVSRYKTLRIGLTIVAFLVTAVIASQLSSRAKRAPKKHPPGAAKLSAIFPEPRDADG